MTEPSDEVKRLAEGLTEDEITVLLNHRPARPTHRSFVSLKYIRAQQHLATIKLLAMVDHRTSRYTPLGKEVALAHYLKDKD